MKNLDLNEVRKYVNENIVTFHKSRIRIVSSLELSKLVKKNPYLFRAKNITKASELVEGTMSAFLSSSEEKLFGDFLEDLAIYVAENTTGGHKSGSQGVDLEFEDGGCHYFISIKSGTNWGNSSQHRKLGEDLQNVVRIFKQRKGQRTQVDSVLGICYGKTRTSRPNVYGYLKLVGQNFWTFISGNKELYREIIKPVGYRAKEHNEIYYQELGQVSNQITKQFIDSFCDVRGRINWEKLVKANSGNYDLNKHGFNYLE